MTKEQLLARADELDAMAKINDSYMRKMEQTAERTNGRLGCYNAPNTYAAHNLAAAQKRRQAADLRAEATQ